MRFLPMQNLWFITNPRSGSASASAAAALETGFAALGLNRVGRTAFPQDALPTAAALDGARVDTLVLFAGDGTVNAALCALQDWQGGFLILPGGTMNLLAKALHGDAEPQAIVAAAARHSDRVPLTYVSVEARRAYVGLILGPAAHWGRVREAARYGRISRMVRAMRNAWRRTFGKGIALKGVPGMSSRYQAVFVSPSPSGLRVSAVDARDWGAILDLGWSWMSGDWVAAKGVTQRAAQHLRPWSSRPILALFDGEPVTLKPGTLVASGTTPPVFLATRGTAQ